MGTPYSDPQAHLYATGYGRSGMAVNEAAYLPIERNQTKIENGKALPSSITFTPPEIDLEYGGFWSLATYDAEDRLAKDKAAISNSEAIPKRGWLRRRWRTAREL